MAGSRSFLGGVQAGLGLTSSVTQPVADDAVQRAEGVLQADLLAFLVSAAGIADRYLVDAPRRRLALGDLGRDLRLEAEAVRLQVQLGQHLAAKDLVAGLHV